MKRLPALLALVALAPLALGQNADLARARKAIIAATEKSNAAYKAKNLSGVTAFLTDDFVGETPDGHLHSRFETIQSLKDDLAKMTSISLVEGKLLSIKRKEKVYVVNQRNHLKAKAKFAGRVHDFESTYESVEYWIQTPKGFRLKYARESKGESKIDGKPMG